jgi:nitrite reductase (NADH) large subunit
MTAVNRKHLVIVGNGIAGVTAAQEAHQTNPGVKITLIGEEDLPYHYRASLTEWITGELNDESIIARTPDFYDDLNIKRVRGFVREVDPEGHCVILGGGKEITYDALCLATGAHARKIPIKGYPEEAIITYRTMEDARRIKEKITPDSRVMIIGGGILGLELAGGLARMGVSHVALVQILDFLGGPVLDKPAARWLEDRVRADGYEIFLEDTVDHIEDQTACLKSGARWDFDLLVESVGVIPTFPKVPGLETGRGVRIDARGRTNLPDIFACGDCTETYDPGTEKWFTTRIWYDCARQGRAAGAAMTGGENPYHKTTFFNCSLVYNDLYSYIGDPHGPDGNIIRDQNETAYRKFRLVDGKLAGALLVNNRRGTIPIFHAVGLDLSPLGPELAKPDFDWNQLTGKDWDYWFY